jgi:hypothetical protein
MDLQHGSAGYVLQADISSFSSFYFGATTITLPLELLTFTGSLLGNNTTLLKWKTTNELNTLKFDVERSIDGINFSTISSVNASGTTSTETNYSLIDAEVASLPATIIYYRLKMIDRDGVFKYSPVISVSLGGIYGSVSIAPNPVSDLGKVVITAPSSGQVTYKLIDNTGRSIFVRSLQVKKNTENILSIDMRHLPNGTYYLKVNGAGIQNSVKVQKL